MPKMKTRKAAAKRFKAVGNGKIHTAEQMELLTKALNS